MPNRDYQFEHDRKERDDVLRLHINIKAAWTILAAVVAGAVWTSTQLFDLKQSIKDGTGDRWRRSSQREWANRLGRQNPSVKVPDPDQVVKDLE